MYNRFAQTNELPYLHKDQTRAFTKPLRSLMHILNNGDTKDVHILSTYFSETRPPSNELCKPYIWNGYRTRALVFSQSDGTPDPIDLGNLWLFMPGILASMVDSWNPDSTMARLRYHLNNGFRKSAATWEPTRGHVILEGEPRTFLSLGQVTPDISEKIIGAVVAHNEFLTK